jgi:hypothetical protein
MRIVAGLFAAALIALGAAFLRPTLWFFVALVVGLALVGLTGGERRSGSKSTGLGDSGLG